MLAFLCHLFLVPILPLICLVVVFVLAFVLGLSSAILSLLFSSLVLSYVSFPPHVLSWSCVVLSLSCLWLVLFFSYLFCLSCLVRFCLHLWVAFVHATWLAMWVAFVHATWLAKCQSICKCKSGFSAPSAQHSGRGGGMVAQVAREECAILRL